MDKRVIAVEIAGQLAEQKIPYLWGGNDPAEGGVDCSGLIRFIFRIVGLMPYRMDMTAQGFFRTMKDNQVPVPYYGCLAFYGPDLGEIKHVVLCLDEKVAIGATSYDGSQAVQRHPIAYRDDLLCYADPFKNS